MMKLNDLVSGKVVSMDEWIYNEIHRLKNNLKPRHFESYGELVEMIQEDPSRFQACNPLPPLSFSLSGTESTVSTPTHSLCTGESEDEVAESNRHHQEEEQQQQASDSSTIDICMNYIDIPLATTITTNHNSITPKYPSHHKKSSLQPPVWLCRVFIELIRYCDQMNHIMHVNSPKSLLNQFEKLRLQVKLGHSIYVNEFREKLHDILFGRIQMTENLVHAWRLMCEWVTRPPINNHQNAVKWVDLTLGAYINAQKFYISHRHLLLKRKSLSQST